MKCILPLVRSLTKPVIKNCIVYETTTLRFLCKDYIKN